MAQACRLAALVVLVLAAAPARGVELPAAPARGVELNVGVTSANGDAAFFVADAKGYFAEEGLVVHFIRFNSAAQMIVPLAAGELDVGGGAASAGLFNAVERDVGIKVVADKARLAPGYGFQALMVRRDLVEAGRFKGFKDLKGLKVAVTSAGSGDASLLNEALKAGGLGFGDADIVQLGIPSQIAAFANGAIDASIGAEPAIAILVRAGTAVRFAGADTFFPNHQTAVTYYGALFIHDKPDAAMTFMRALVRGMRFYDDALADGHLAGPNAEEVIAILTAATSIKDPELYRAIISHACDPDGNIDMASLRKDWQFFLDTGQIDGRVGLDEVIDMSFARAAVAGLGPYHPRRAR